MDQVPDDWLRDYYLVALRTDQALADATGGRALIYTGPDRWRHDVDSGGPVGPERLADDCDRLLEQNPLQGGRAEYARSQLTALRTCNRQLTDNPLPFEEFIRLTLDIEPAPVPEEVLSRAHDRLDAALPAGPGTLAARLHAWRDRHTLADGDDEALKRYAGLAVSECANRTRKLFDLPEADVDIVLAPGAHRGHYAGNGRGTVHLSNSMPFNLADLIYVVAHESFPGHIAESMLIVDEAAGRLGRHEQHVRFMVSGSFVVSEGIGLHAPGIVFPGDQAQAWLADHVFAEAGIVGDGGDLAAIHLARNDLWAAWGNAALMAATGDPVEAVKDYLIRWALMSDEEVAWAVGSLEAATTSRGGAMLSAYLLAYHHGWRLVGSRFADGAAENRFVSLLTEPHLPSQLGG